MERKASTATRVSSNSGILVEREIVFHADDHVGSALTASRTPSVRTIVCSMSDVRRDSKQAELAGDLISPLQLSSLARHPDVTLGHFRELLDEEESNNGIQELIQLLRQSPPPGNLMSIPDHLSSSSEEDRWTKLKTKVLRRKRKKGRRVRTPSIKLPDSAIAATTTDGHRHIAISIPSEHSHLGPQSPSQYPVYESMEAEFQREIESRFGVARNSAADRAVTVLKPVAEDRESASSISLSPGESPYSNQPLSVRPKRSQSAPSPPKDQRFHPRKGKDPIKRRSVPHGEHAPVLERPPSVFVRSPDSSRPQTSRTARGETGFGFVSKSTEPGTPGYDIVTQTIEITPPRRHGKRTRTSSRGQTMGETLVGQSAESQGQGHARGISGGSHSASATRTTPPILLTLPSRSSSKTAQTGKAVSTGGIPTTTIDNVVNSQRSSLSGQGSSHSNSNGSNNNNNSRKGSGGGGDGGGGGGLGLGHDLFAASRQQRGSFADSLITTESSPKLFKAQTATAYQSSVPIVVRSPPSQADTESPLNLNFPVPPGGIDRAVQTGGTSPSVLARSTAGSTPPLAYATSAPVSRENTNARHPRRPRASTQGSAHSQRRDRVREMKQRDIERQLQRPAPSGEEPRRHCTVSSAPPTRTVSTAQPPDVPPVPASAMAGMPPPLRGMAPPTSALGQHHHHQPGGSMAPRSRSASLSAADSPSTYDSSSSSQRRRRHGPGSPYYIATPPLQQPSAGGEAEAGHRLSRRELQARYDGLREAQMRDTERRLRRLERNADVWLRSLQPMMDTLNRLLAEQQGMQRALGLAPPVSAYHHLHRHPQQGGGVRPDEPSSRSLTSLSEPRRSGSYYYRDSGAGESSAGAAGSGRPFSFATGESASMRGGHGGHHHHPNPTMTTTESLAPLTPLQAEFEREMAARRALERRDDEIDAAMRQRRDEGHMVPTSATTEGDAGYYSSRSVAGKGGGLGLDTIEPLMRELQGAARFETAASARGSHRHSGLGVESGRESLSVEEREPFASF
ncbi:hypothetical protein F4780DRAFT_467871 [Xylariomycetidae sp. FL0641]|nr:hypothetical protein F4780DRAFT_467871 [Xylariomycetidae sp. FL0641]